MTYHWILAVVLFSCLFYVSHCQQCELYPIRPLGMTDRFNGVKDDQITASSKFSADTDPKYARLHYSDAFYWDWSLGGAGAWVAQIQDTQQYLQVDFKTRVIIHSVATQGRMGSKEYVKDYYLKYTDNLINSNWVSYRDEYGSPYLFEGNTNDTGVKENTLRYPLIARYVRIYPQRWNRLIALRAEFFGCDYEQHTAFFDGKSRIDFRLDLPGRAVQSYNESIRFRFRTKESHGLILYGDDGQGDYIVVELINGQLRIGLDLGFMATGGNSFYAGSLLDDDQWHDVRISRVYKMFNVTIDRMESWADVKGDFLQLNLNRNLSLAGLPVFTGKRGLESKQNFTGCLENVYFNGLNIIRDAKNMTLLGPKVSRVQGFVVHGALASCSLATPSTRNLITFLSDISWIRTKLPTQGGVFTASLKFRTFQKGGTFFFHQLDANDLERHLWIGILKGSNNVTLEINYYDKARKLYPTRVDYSNENPTAKKPASFSNGLWHDLSVDISLTGIVMKIDGYTYNTQQMLNVPWGETTYIGGYTSKYPFFIGCMSAVNVNNKFLEFSTITANDKEGSIEAGSCQVRDYCSPNPCMHDAKCTPSAFSFDCDCSGTGYTGAVCYRPKYATSCAEEKLLLKPHEGRINRKNVTIDLDGPGILKPFNVTCDFTRPGPGVWTYVSHDSLAKRRVDGFEAPGSYKHDINYNGADIAALSEFVRRSVYCEQNIAYDCHMAKLLARPPAGETTDENRAYGWWIGRRGQPRFYWGGSVPGHRKCLCGLKGNCAGSSDSCNCDSPGQISQDSGLLKFKDDLPVRGVRLGDTGTVHDDHYSDFSVGRLECRGDKLFDNTVTFRKLDSFIEMPPVWSYTEFSVSFFFKTTQRDGVFFQNINMKNQHSIEVRLRQSRTIRFIYNVGFGLRVLDLDTTNELNDNQWHIVRVERNRKEAALVVDEHAPRTLREPVDQAFRVFVFEKNLFIGATSDFTDGYLGCMSNFMVNGVMLDLRGVVESGTRTYGLSAGCVPKCASSPCLNRGECQEYYSHYYCECGLTPFRGYVCGREVGAAFLNNPMLKVKLDLTGVQNMGTVDEYMQIGFKTRKPSGTLMQLSSANNREYIKVLLNTQCGITVYLDVGFQLREVTSDFNVRLCTDQHHTVIVWRSKEGRQVNIKVDDYHTKMVDFSDLLNEDSDTRLDNPEFLYIGRNTSDETKTAFEGCLYRMQFNNFFPLKMLFQEPKNPLVSVFPNNSIIEHRCGIEEVMPFPEPIEIKPFPTIPPNRTLLPFNRDAGLSPSITAGIVLAVLFFVILLAVLFFCRNFTIEKGDYETYEAKGAGMVDHADVAIRFGRTGHPEIKGKEWWI